MLITKRTKAPALGSAWVASAPQGDLVAALNAGSFRRELSEHDSTHDDNVRAVLERPDADVLEQFLDRFGTLPAWVAHRYLDRGQRPPWSATGLTLLDASLVERLKVGATALEADLLVANQSLGPAELLELYAYFVRTNGPGRVLVSPSSVANHPSVTAELLDAVRTNSARTYDLVVSMVADTTAGTECAVRFTHTWRGAATESGLRDALRAAQVKPTAGMGVWYLADNHPEFLTKTCKSLGVDPEVGAALASGWTGTTSDFLAACSELAPDDHPATGPLASLLRRLRRR
jgi:hypothetical protein